MIIKMLEKVKLRSIIAIMIYATWCILLVISFYMKIKYPDRPMPEVPRELTIIVMGQYAYYWGSKQAKKIEQAIKND